MTIPLYPEIIFDGDLTPDAGGANIDAKVEEISEACKGWGTDEKRLIKAMAWCTPQERAQVATKYKEIRGEKLEDLVKKECKGDFGEALQLLAVAPDEAECDIIKKAGKGIGTDELLLYPVICGRTNKEIDVLKKKFYKRYDKDLGAFLNKELGGPFEKLIFNCLQGVEEDFDPDYHTDDLVAQDVEELHSMSEGRFGTNESGLFKILSSRPAQHLQKVNMAYADKYDVTLFKVMDDELRGKTRDATLFLLGLKLKTFDTIAKLLKKACQGFGTNELLFASTIIRYQMCLPKVLDAYKDLYGESLVDTIKTELHGKTETLLVELCKAASA